MNLYTKGMLSCGVLCVLTLGAASAGGIGRMVLDPGEGVPVTAAAALAGERVAAGSTLPLVMALGDHRIEVLDGELTLMLPGSSEILIAGTGRMVPAGTAFQLVNRSAHAARVVVTMQPQVIDAPTRFSAAQPSS